LTVVPFKDSIPPGEPNADLVEALEVLLRDAQSGVLRALAYAVVREGNVIATGWDGSDGTRNSVGMAVMLLHHRYAGAVFEDIR
jgi:hypothetical protein